MKKAASIFLVVFSLTIALPLANSFLVQSHIILLELGEEKSSSNQINEIKEEKKDITNQFYLYLNTTLSSVLLPPFCPLHLNMPDAPSLEKSTPPPNYC